MSHLIAVSFEDEQRADEVRAELMRMQRDYLVELEDAVVAIRKQNGKVKLRQLHSLTAGGALTGGFWGTLIGLLFLHPVFGLAVGAAAGAIAGALGDVGIDDAFMKQLAERVQPGCSVLFVLLRQVTPDKVLAELERFQGHVLHTSLSHEDETKLREVLEHAPQGA
jgi:uncharacterized membrane protein